MPNHPFITLPTGFPGSGKAAPLATLPEAYRYTCVAGFGA